MRSPLLALFLLLIAAPVRAEVYLTKEQALDVTLGKECVRRADTKELTEEIRDRLSNEGISPSDEEVTRADFFVCESQGKPSGYALIDSQVGKHLPITYVVGISPEGKVTRVELMVFRESRGWEVRERKFMAQFEGRGRGENFRLGREIANASGATISAASMTKGVKRALALWDYYYGSKRS
jgi:Na+-translocating ferredoxin:NAD+ oxidoreductase RnfG subunit